MRVALDTNRYTDVARGVNEALLMMVEYEEIYLPFIVLGELLVGFRKGTRRAENEAELKKFLSLPDVSVLWPDEGTTDLYANLRLHLERQGTPLPENDIWIAAVCVRHGVPLYTRDAHFDRLPQLMRV